jgi:hypothetical protein
MSTFYISRLVCLEAHDEIPAWVNRDRLPALEEVKVGALSWVPSCWQNWINWDRCFSQINDTGTTFIGKYKEVYIKACKAVPGPKRSHVPLFQDTNRGFRITIILIIYKLSSSWNVSPNDEPPYSPDTIRRVPYRPFSGVPPPS